jgi:N-acetylglucosaminyl-diphospho-decaprenol L-rhamnosyltransferase
MSDVGIVIVTYNSEAEIGNSLVAALRTGADVVVVDNASRDQTVAQVARRGVRLIANAVNRGFAAAANQGFAALKSRYVLLLNPDAVIQTDLAPLCRACDLPGVAAAGGLLLGPDGAPQTGFNVRRLPTPAALILEVLLLNRAWPKNPINRRYRGLDWNLAKSVEVEQPAGAFLMVRRAVWQELGGLDEGFQPLWFEDVDLCRRIRDRGYRILFIPDAVANHTGAHSIVKLPVVLRNFYWYGSLLRYSAKHFRPLAFRALCLAVVVGSFLRMIGESALESSLEPVAAYRKVVRLASRSFLFGWRDAGIISGPQ